MALKDFLNAKNEKFDEFENPTAFEKDDCLSCRVIGMAPKDQVKSFRANHKQGRRRWYLSVVTRTFQA